MRRLVITALVLAGAIVAWSVWALYAANSFSGRIAAIRAAGDPASIADLAPEGVPDEQNSAAPLLAAAPRVKAFARDHGQFFNTPLGKAYEDAKSRGEPANAEQLAAIGTIVQKYSDVDVAVAEAATRDQYASPLDYSLAYLQFIDQAGKPPIDIRSIARYFEWQMELAASEGRPADAVQKGIELLRLARLSRAEPGLISGLMAHAVYGVAAQATCNALSSGPIPAELHAALEQELVLGDSLEAAAWMFKSERALAIDAIQAQFGGAQGLFMNTIGRSMKLHHTAALDFFDAILPDAVAPWYEVAAKSPLSMIYKTSTGLGVMADMLQPPFQVAYESANRALAVTRSLRVYNALRQFDAEQGREAEGLDELDLPKEATIDPFSGQPLQLKRTDDSWLIYSVGKDGVDDGGSFDDSKDYGLRPRKRTK